MEHAGDSRRFSRQAPYDSNYYEALYREYVQASRPSRTVLLFTGRVADAMTWLVSSAVLLFILGCASLSIGIVGMSFSFVSIFITCWAITKAFGLKAEVMYNAEREELRHFSNSAINPVPYSVILRDELNRKAAERLYRDLFQHRKYPSTARLIDERRRILAPLIAGIACIVLQLGLFALHHIEGYTTITIALTIVEMAFALLAFSIRKSLSTLVEFAQKELRQHQILGMPKLAACNDEPPEYHLAWIWALHPSQWRAPEQEAENS